MKHKLIMENWRRFMTESEDDDVRDTYDDEVVKRNEKQSKKARKQMGLSEESDKDPEKPHDDGDEHDERCDYIDCDGDDESVDEAKNKDGRDRGLDGKACWKGYKHAGSEDTDGDGEPDKDKCVPIKEKKKTDKDRMKANAPRYIKQGEPGYGKKQKVVKACKKGDDCKIVRFGDANMENKSDNADNKSNFRSRHNCADKKDKHTAGYWACKDW